MVQYCHDALFTADRTYSKRAKLTAESSNVPDNTPVVTVEATTRITPTIAELVERFANPDGAWGDRWSTTRRSLRKPNLSYRSGTVNPVSLQNIQGKKHAR